MTENDERQEQEDRETAPWLRQKKTRKMVQKASQELEEAVENRIVAGNELAVVTLHKLVNWVPECGFPGNVRPAYCGPVTPVKEYREAQDLNSELPFCSESYTYEVWGKDDARSFLALLEQLARALGLEGLHDRRLR